MMTRHELVGLENLTMCSSAEPKAKPRASRRGSVGVALKPRANSSHNSVPLTTTVGVGMVRRSQNFPEKTDSSPRSSRATDLGCQQHPFPATKKRQPRKCEDSVAGPKARRACQSLRCVSKGNTAAAWIYLADSRNVPLSRSDSDFSSVFGIISGTHPSLP